MSGRLSPRIIMKSNCDNNHNLLKSLMKRHLEESNFKVIQLILIKDNVGTLIQHAQVMS